MKTQITWKKAIISYRHPRIWAMLFLGFSAGLPFLLVFSTLSAWLKDEGISLAVIGFFGWIGITYSIKVFWAPVVDHIRLPTILNRLGRRRSWVLLAQLGIIIGLVGMALSDPSVNLQSIIIFAFLVALSSATQDIAIDAWRIEALAEEYQGAMAGTYQLGYRLGMIVAGGGAFSLAHFYSWPLAYSFMAAFMVLGVITVFLIPEPDHEAESGRTGRASEGVISRLGHWFAGAVIGPFAEFFVRHGWFAVVILLFIMVFRISDITLGVMANPFYIDMGYNELQIGLVTKTVGPLVTIAGALVGGVLVMRYGKMRMLMTGAALVVLTNLLFAWLATQENELLWLILVVGADNLAAGIATTTFVAYLSALTHQAYTATQYALFSSIMLLLAKFLAGFSGLIVDISSYPVFFVYAAALGLPSMFLIMVLMRHETLALDNESN